MSLPDLNKLIHRSTLEDVVNLVDNLNEESLAKCVACHRDGIFHYSSLHESVACGKADILDYLLTKTKDAYVNLKDSSGYVLLHIAASSGQLECLKTLLSHGADIKIKDGLGKTPAEIADLCCHMNILRALKKEELLKEIEVDGDRVTELLKNSSDHLDNNYLGRCLVAATRNGSIRNMVRITMKGATNFDECLVVAHELSKSNVIAQLLLYQAAYTGNRNLLSDLFSDPSASTEHSYKNFMTTEVRESAKSHDVSKVTPMRIASRKSNFLIQQNLLMKIGVNIQTATVNWHELWLSSLELPWLQGITWVKKLRLDRNYIGELPASIGSYLKVVTYLDLTHNNLTTLPPGLFKMPALCELYLKHNQLTELPAVPTWPDTLMILDLSHNSLNSLPPNIQARRIRSINVSHNKLHSVPSCICSFPTLCTLVLDDNPDIVSLPRELGELKRLSTLSLRNLNCLANPLRMYIHDTKSCLKYLRSISDETSQPVCSTNLMVVGPRGKGKSTFVNNLMGTEHSQEKLKGGVRATSWSHYSNIFKLMFHFRIWCLSGDDTYLYTQQVVGFNNSLYAVVLNLNDGEAGIEELKPWFNIISQIAPHSKVVIVGTHLDEISAERKGKTEAIFKKILDISDGKVQIIELIAIGLENTSDFHQWLLTTICKCAQFLNNQIADGVPLAYHKLNFEFKLIQQKAAQGTRSPLMHIEELKTLVLATNTNDIDDEVALEKLIENLCNTGALVRFSGRNGLLRDLFCVDFQWLSQVISSLTEHLEQNQTTNTGVLSLDDSHSFFDISKFPHSDSSENVAAFVESLVTGICFNNKIVVPCLFLPEEPRVSKSVSPADTSLYHRCIAFKMGVPAGFWNLLLCQIFQTISVVREAMMNRLQVVDQKISEGETAHANEFGDINSKNTDNVAETNEISDDLKVQFVESAQHERSLPPACVNTEPLSAGFQKFDSNTNSPSHEEPGSATLHYWKTGMLYQNNSILLCVKSLSNENSDTDGTILISSSPDDRGKELAVQIVDLVYSVMKKWFYFFSDNLHELDHNISCSKCTKAECKFSYHQCIKSRAESNSDIKCDCVKSTDDHSASLIDIAPDVLLRDVDHTILNYSDICIEEDDKTLIDKDEDRNTVLLKGALQNKNVTVEKFLTYDVASFHEMRTKLKELNKIRHPCLVGTVGTCIYPLAIIVERSPLTSLSSILAEQTCIPSLTFFRIAAEVAAALRFLHRNGIILGRFNATNVMMWTLDPNSLCHCKLATPSTFAYFPEVMQEPLSCHKGFSAPEVLEMGRKNHTLNFTQEADSFSFGVFLTQLITQQQPYQFTHASRVDEKVMHGVRPKLEGVVTFKGGYSYLSMLLKKCRESLPEDRPTMDDIIGLVTSVKTQLLVGAYHVDSEHAPSCTVGFSLRDTEIPPTVTLQDELWMFYDEEKEKLRILNSHSLFLVYSSKIADLKEIKCAVRQNNRVWVNLRYGGIEEGPSGDSV